ncbi:MAG: pectate lyase [Bacteroidaceae bacterium]|nr:pectate lyase [Bacteroidaceae bacterium]
MPLKGDFGFGSGSEPGLKVQGQGQSQSSEFKSEGEKPLKPNAAWRKISRRKDVKFLKSDEAARVAEQVMLYQRVTGGWPKNIDFARQMTEQEKADVRADYNREDDSTTDNNATNVEMTFLARMYNATGKAEYRDAVARGIKYLLSGQYDSGGWPQFWPVMKGYQKHITYNDDAMANTIMLLRNIRDGVEPYNNDIADAALKDRVATAIDKAIDCILKTQIVYNGELTVWCQQHYPDTYLPAPARAYELPSFCSQESALLVSLLMDVKNPSEAIKKSVDAAIRWFEKYKITGIQVRRSPGKNGKWETELREDPSATEPLWARFYDLQNCQPFFCDRDGVPRKRLDEIGEERRNGYSWYNRKALELNIFEKYRRWLKENQ